MVRIITLNLNGIRSAASKGFFDWLPEQDADIVCLQELKAQQADLASGMLQPPGYQGFFHFARKKGYSGVGIYTRYPPTMVTSGFGVAEFDDEGRYVQVDFNHLSVISVYVPSGSSGPERQASKYRFMDCFLPHLSRLKDKGKQIILCGDINIARTPLDLANPAGNRKNSGFLPEERAWLDVLFNETGFVDVFRQIEKGPNHYTWWSNRGQAWAKNVGWRIDYQIATTNIAHTAVAAGIHVSSRFSDHAPLSIEYSHEI
ncbi:MAG: exodeoxyribonuclease III [Proteobacteria bacterium]|nr:exodeoxyribonuclease III [Pseudomonadota bacterium]